MSILSRLNNAARQQGLRGVAAKVLARPADYWFDWRWGADTLQHERLDQHTIVAGERRRGGFYEGSRTLAVRAMLREMRRRPEGAGTFVDVGCGKGKALLLAAQCGFPAVRGVEFSQELCGVARANLERFAARFSAAPPFEVIAADAAAHEYSADETLYFFFNPFDATILAVVLDRIAESIATAPRPAAAVFACATREYRNVLDAHRGLRHDEELVRWGVPFSVYGWR